MKKQIISFLTAACTVGSIGFNSVYAEGTSIIDIIDIDSIISESSDFADGGVIYSDKYQFSYEQGTVCDYIVVYGIQPEECYDSQINDHIIFDLNNCSYSFEPWYPAGEGKDPWSGRTYSFTMLDSQIKESTDKPTNILFFVENELPLGFDTIEAANESYGFDVSKYIYSTAEYALGDISGDTNIDPVDATLALQQYSVDSMNGEAVLNDNQKLAADVNADGVIDPVDATWILRYYSYASMNGTGTLEEFIESN